jgi:hypothetical protein
MKLITVILGLLFFTESFAQLEPPQIFFKEDWNKLPPFDLMTPYSLTQADVMNPELIQKLYGPAQDSVKKRHHGSENDPYYIFTGFCGSNWAVTLSHKNLFADLTGNALIRCRMMNSGFRGLHIIIKLADGTWLVSDKSEGSSSVWQIHDFVIKDINWRQLNITTIVEGSVVKSPDLRQVDEIGFTDLMNGGRSEACSRVDWMEVYANSSKRY